MFIHASPLVLALALGLAACVPGGSTPAADDRPARDVTEVVIDDMQFQPEVIEVAAGTAVTWAFEDGSMQHDVQGDGWGSEIQSSGTFTHRFDEPGTYNYRCSLHPNMTARVVVTR